MSTSLYNTQMVYSCCFKHKLHIVKPKFIEFNYQVSASMLNNKGVYERDHLILISSLTRIIPFQFLVHV